VRDSEYIASACIYHRDFVPRPSESIIIIVKVLLVRALAVYTTCARVYCTCRSSAIWSGRSKTKTKTRRRRKKNYGEHEERESNSIDPGPISGFCSNAYKTRSTYWYGTVCICIYIALRVFTIRTTENRRCRRRRPVRPIYKNETYTTIYTLYALSTIYNIYYTYVYARARVERPLSLVAPPRR